MSLPVMMNKTFIVKEADEILKMDSPLLAQLRECYDRSSRFIMPMTYIKCQNCGFLASVGLQCSNCAWYDPSTPTKEPADAAREQTDDATLYPDEPFIAESQRAGPDQSNRE